MTLRTRVASILLGMVAVSISGCPTASDELVVYCAWDAAFSKQVLDDFEKETGISVAMRFDTEATKSLGLVNQIIRERKAPRCDVFWNNETLGTIDLARRGLTEPYKGPGWKRIPARYKDPDGLWCGFAARLRVWIVNTDQMPAEQEAVKQAFQDNLTAFTYAKPLFGTTLTHCCVLWSTLGKDKFIALEKRLRETATVVNGNAQTRDLVAAGTFALGWTDTDDYYSAVDSGKPVDMVPVRLDSGETICIPNSVAIIEGTDHRKQAERLVDYLLSRENELRLARSKSRQIPLGDIGDEQLPEDVQKLVAPAEEGIDLSGAADAREDVLNYLSGVYAK